MSDTFTETRTALARAGIDSEAALLDLANAGRARVSTLVDTAWMLGRWPEASKNRRFLSAACALLDHPSARVRREASVSLGLFQLKEAGPPLLRALADRDQGVRSRALMALGLLARPADLGAIVRVLRHRREYPVVRACAADALASFKAARAAPALMSALQDRASEVRASAAHSLGELHVSRAATQLANLATTDPSLTARRAARSALIRLGAASSARPARRAANTR